MVYFEEAVRFLTPSTTTTWARKPSTGRSTLTEGEFKIEDGIRTNIKTNEIKWSELVLEGMRIYDEDQVGQDEVHPP